MSSENSKTIVLVTWLLTIFFGFIPSLVVYLIKQDNGDVRKQAATALNWCITIIVGYLAVYVITSVLGVGFIFLSIIWAVNLIVCILALVSVSKTGSYEPPFSLNLVK